MARKRVGRNEAGWVTIGRARRPGPGLCTPAPRTPSDRQGGEHGGGGNDPFLPQPAPMARLGAPSLTPLSLGRRRSRRSRGLWHRQPLVPHSRCANTPSAAPPPPPQIEEAVKKEQEAAASVASGGQGGGGGGGEDEEPEWERYNKVRAARLACALYCQASPPLRASPVLLRAGRRGRERARRRSAPAGAGARTGRASFQPHPRPTPRIQAAHKERRFRFKKGKGKKADKEEEEEVRRLMAGEGRRARGARPCRVPRARW